VSGMPCCTKPLRGGFKNNKQNKFES